MSYNLHHLKQLSKQCIDQAVKQGLCESVGEANQHQQPPVSCTAAS